ncbi:HigA family addiction module antitoxin [Phaeospirillum tilakii]|uniref:HigA family addiction module antitoxin n=1 Tax=Phaeospirillum tilakii TaxID=741673 RepID=A0ABW5C942_9PROT
MSIPATDNLPPIHPGEFLRDELDALSLSARRFAAHIQVAPNAVTAILKGQRGISGQMALRLGQAFGTGPDYWMRLQDLYEVKRARAEMQDVLASIPRLGAD